MQQTRSNVASRYLYAARLPNIILWMLQVTKHKQNPLHFWTSPSRSLVCLALTYGCSMYVAHYGGPSACRPRMQSRQAALETLTGGNSWTIVMLLMFSTKWCIYRSTTHPNNRWLVCTQISHPGGISQLMLFNCVFECLPVLYRINHKRVLSVVMPDTFGICRYGTLASTLAVTSKHSVHCALSKQLLFNTSPMSSYLELS